MKKPFLTLSFILITLLVLGGCSSENEDLKTKKLMDWWLTALLIDLWVVELRSRFVNLL